MRILVLCELLGCARGDNLAAAGAPLRPEVDDPIGGFDDVDVLQRVGQHPAKRVVELTPRVWKTLFADRPLRSDLDRTQDPPPQ